MKILSLWFVFEEGVTGEVGFLRATYPKLLIRSIKFIHRRNVTIGVI